MLRNLSKKGPQNFTVDSIRFRERDVTLKKRTREMNPGYPRQTMTDSH
jgi:hypothetical protein